MTPTYYLEWKRSKPKTFLPPFILIRDDGETWTYYTLNDLAIACAKAKIKINDNHIIHGYENIWHGGKVKFKKCSYKNDFIARDDLGQIVSQKDIEIPFTYYHIKKQKLVRENQQHAVKLGLPIPHTGKRSGGHCYRRMKFINVWREAAAFQVDDEMKEMRIKGKIKLPPNNWNDYTISARYDRNWKRHRLHHWKN